VRKIRDAINNETEVTVQLINYTKTGIFYCFDLNPPPPKKEKKKKEHCNQKGEDKQHPPLIVNYLTVKASGAVPNFRSRCLSLLEMHKQNQDTVFCMDCWNSINRQEIIEELMKSWEEK